MFLVRKTNDVAIVIIHRQAIVIARRQTSPLQEAAAVSAGLALPLPAAPHVDDRVAAAGSQSAEPPAGTSTPPTVRLLRGRDAAATAAAAAAAQSDPRSPSSSPRLPVPGRSSRTTKTSTVGRGASEETTPALARRPDPVEPTPVSSTVGLRRLCGSKSTGFPSTTPPAPLWYRWVPDAAASETDGMVDGPAGGGRAGRFVVESPVGRPPPRCPAEALRRVHSRSMYGRW